MVCAAARNHAELLKCLQQLTNSIYPRHQHQEEQQQQQQQQQCVKQRDRNSPWQQQKQEQQQEQWGQNSQGQQEQQQQPCVQGLYTDHSQKDDGLLQQQLMHLTLSPPEHYNQTQQQMELLQNSALQQRQKHLLELPLEMLQEQQQQQRAVGLTESQSDSVLSGPEAGAAAMRGPPPGLGTRLSINSTNTVSGTSSVLRTSITTTSSSERGSMSFAPLLSVPWCAAAAERREEVSAALLLYFACVPHKPLVPELVKQLRRAAAEGKLQQGGFDGIGGSGAWELALVGVRAWLRMEWGVFLDCYERAPLLLKLVMEGAVPRVSARF
jgi:hypothetical protein